MHMLSSEDPFLAHLLVWRRAAKDCVVHSFVRVIFSTIVAVGIHTQFAIVIIQGDARMPMPYANALFHGPDAAFLESSQIALLCALQNLPADHSQNQAND